MKIPKTLAFIVSNPLTFIVPLFVSWISFSVLATLSDDPFIYGTWPDIVEGASIRTAVALIIGEIINDFASELYWIAIPAALLISFWSAISHAKGIAKERQLWMPWYQQQQNAIAQGNTLEELPTASENIGTNAYFRNTLKCPVTPDSTSDILCYSFFMLVFCLGAVSCYHTPQQRNGRNSILSREVLS